VHKCEIYIYIYIYVKLKRIGIIKWGGMGSSFVDKRRGQNKGRKREEINEVLAETVWRERRIGGAARSRLLCRIVETGQAMSHSAVLGVCPEDTFQL
jgi:hypothetical protein